MLVCLGPTCGDRRGGRALHDHLVARLAERGLSGKVGVEREMCLGRCVHGPNVLVCETNMLYGRDATVAPGLLPGAVLYTGVALPDMDSIVDRHLAGGVRVSALKPRPAR